MSDVEGLWFQLHALKISHYRCSDIPRAWVFYWGQLCSSESPTCNTGNPVSGSALTKKKPPAVTELKTSTCLNPSAPKLIILMSMQKEDHAGNVCTGWFKNSKCHTAEIKTENTKRWLETVREYFIRWQHKHSCERPQCLMICFCEQWKNPVLLQLCAPGLPYPHQRRCSFCQAFSQWLRHP